MTEGNKNAQTTKVKQITLQQNVRQRRHEGAPEKPLYGTRRHQAMTLEQIIDEAVKCPWYYVSISTWCGLEVREYE